MDVILYSKIQKVGTKVDSAITEEEVHEKSENLFDKNSVTNGYYFKQYGDDIGSLVADQQTCIAYVELNGAGNYSLFNAKSFIGDLANQVLLFDESKNYLTKVTGSFDSGNNRITHCIITDTEITSGAKYIGYTANISEIGIAMVVKSSTYPSEYIPYYDNNYTRIGFAGHITEDNADFITDIPASENFYNKADSIDGYAMSAENGSLVSFSTMCYTFVPIKGAGSYTFYNAVGYYGTYYAKRALLFNESKTFIKYVAGDIDSEDQNISHVEISSADIESGAFYFGYCIEKNKKDIAMFVEGSTYPAEYIPFYEGGYGLSESIPVLNGGKQDNILFNKKVVFDGDSICYGSGNGGWAKIIGENNKMEWHNVGVSGGTITAELYISGQGARHWVSRYIDTIHSNYPALDYLIFEGGTNDADLLTNEEIGTLDQANYSTFDDTTFIGALESLFNKAISYYPKAKIGFIIAQKMGTSSSYGYDAGDSPSTRRRRKFFEIIIDVCKKWGIRYVDLWEGSPLCPKLPVYYDGSKTSEENEAAGKAYKDGQHLTQTGYGIVSPIIEEWMKTL